MTYVFIVLSLLILTAMAVMSLWMTGAAISERPRRNRHRHR